MMLPVQMKIRSEETLRLNRADGFAAWPVTPALGVDEEGQAVLGFAKGHTMKQARAWAQMTDAKMLREEKKLDELFGNMLTVLVVNTDTGEVFF